MSALIVTGSESGVDLHVDLSGAPCFRGLAKAHPVPQGLDGRSLPLCFKTELGLREIPLHSLPLHHVPSLPTCCVTWRIYAPVLEERSVRQLPLPVPTEAQGLGAGPRLLQRCPPCPGTDGCFIDSLMEWLLKCHLE